MKKYFSFFIIFMIGGCFWGEDFYNDYTNEDLRGLPLIKPYELTNIYRITRETRFGDNWHLSFKNLLDSTVPAQTNVSLINVDKGILYGYGTANPCDYFVINTITGEERLYKDTLDWEKQLTGLNIDHKKVYDVLGLFYKFKNAKTLMWRPVKG